MTTSIDPSVDELLLLQENQYHMPNFVLTNIKPIGAERKIGQPTQRVVPRDIQENNYYLNSVEILSSTKSITTPIYSSIDESQNLSITNELESSIYPSVSNYSSSSASSTSSGSSTVPSPRSPSHLLDNYIYQRQISSSVNQQKFNQSISTRIYTGKLMPSFCTTQTNRFYAPQHYTRNSFLNLCQQTRSIQPIFSAPFQCTRERFQVNSIGRPILRTNTYHHHHLSQIHNNLKVRR